ncbi:MAG: phosphodiester glycosidase family protein [Ruminococcaceae bacterium]|nr:phosphodiester glycosidase family protein [Oscillospiraceae bacterium]
MKKLTSFLLALIIAFSGISAYCYTPIYALTQQIKYIDGLEFKNIRSLTDAGWLNINIATADLNKDYIDIELLKNEEDIRKLENVKSLANNNDTHIAVNGDFFSWASDEKGMGSSVGVEIKDGNLLTSYSRASTSQAVFMKAEDKNMLFDYIDTYMSITAPNGEGEVLKHINKYDDLSGIVLYNKYWGKTSPGSQSFQVEMVVEDDIVTAINYDQGPCEIPENGYVLSFLKDQSTFLIDNFSVGDKISIDVNIEPDYENINLAMGGGTLLVKDGKIAPNTHNISGLNPRTALGLDESGKILYFITIDGRQKESVGVSLQTLSEILINNGVYNAINLDGGGSTTMVAKNVTSGENEVVNIPSDGGLRSVINAIGVKMTKEKEEAVKIELSSDKENMFMSSVAQIVAIAYDKNGQNLGVIPSDKILWKTDYGTLEDNNFYPDTLGEAVVEAEYNGIKSSIKFNVYKDMVNADDLKDENLVVSENSFSFAAFGNILSNNTFGEMGIKRVFDKKIKNEGYDLALFAGSNVKDGANGTKSIKSDGFDSYEYKNCTFISMNNNSSSVSENGISQWARFIDTIEKTKNKNIFIVLSESPVFPNMSEQDLYNELVEKYLCNKNVFVLYSGNGEVYTYNNIAHFGIKGAESITLQNILETEYVLFNVEDGNVKYTLQKIVDK